MLPQAYRGKLFGVEPLQGQVVLSDVQPFQSSFETKDLERVLKTDDPWFRPVDIKAGPDGCIYVADMYEQRIDHSSHYAGRVDRTNGRIYRLRPVDLPKSPTFDYGKWNTTQLVGLLEHPSRWHRQTALRLLGDRNDASLQSMLLKKIGESSGQTALEMLWALHASSGLNAQASSKLLEHRDPFVRAWTIRILADSEQFDEPLAEAAKQLAAKDYSIEVRKQLASSAKRLPSRYALPILSNLLTRDEDASDIHQPLLVWWAIESHIGSVDAGKMLAALVPDANAWKRPLVTGTMLERWMKRYAMTGRREDLLSAAKLLAAAPDKTSAELLLKGFEEAFQGRSLASIPDEMAAAIQASGGGSLALRLRQGQSDAIATAVDRVNQPATKANEKIQLIEIFGQTARAEMLPVLAKLLKTEKEARTLAATLSALQAFDDPQVAQSVIESYAGFSGEALLAAESLLSSRPAWSLAALQAIDQKQIDGGRFSVAAVRKMMLHPQPEIAALIKKHWGEVAGASSSQMLAEIARVNEVLRNGSGNPKQGKIQFTTHCGRCHRLFEEGGGIGPDLTPFARTNTERMLVNIVNPNLEIREGFENYLVTTADGRVLTGFLADKDQQVVIVRGADGQNAIVRRDDVEVMKAIPQSVMPEGTLKPLGDQQLRDLFAYLRSSQPVN